MLLLDPRVGSGELLPYFKPYDIEVSVQSLDSADLAWWGNGHDGPVLIGAERKIITDLIASMRSNRLSGHQLTGLLETYAFNYLIVEGVWRCGPEGTIQVKMWHDKGFCDICNTAHEKRKYEWGPLRVGSRPVLFREVDHYLATLEHRVGFTIKYTTDEEQTAAYVVSRYRWWNDKDWYQHDSFEAVYAPYEPRIQGRRGSFTRRIAGPVEVVAAQFPGVDKKAYEFGKLFKNVHEMVNADAKGIEKVEGIGKKGANRIYDWLRGKS